MKPAILIFAPGRPTFVDQDALALSTLAPTEFFSVLDKNPIHWLTAAFKIPSAKICYFWFGSFRHWPFLLLAKMFGRKIVMVAGGYDVEGLPEIGYGAFTHSAFSQWLRRRMFALADKILAVSEYTRQRSLTHLNLPNERIVTIPNACAQNSAPLKSWQERKRQVALLISAADSSYLVKGLDRVSDIAEKLPDVQFCLAGRLSDNLTRKIQANAPANLRLLGFLRFQGPEFNELLNSSRVVLLPSRCESFGAALIDGAMLGCVPVSFAVGGLTETSAGLGEVSKDGNLSELVYLIRKVVDSSDQNPAKQRSLATQRFTLEPRLQRLRQTLQVFL